MSIVLFAIQAFNMIKAAVGAGMALKDAYDLLQKYQDKLQLMNDENRGPTDAEWDDLNAESEALRAARPTVDD